MQVEVSYFNILFRIGNISNVESEADFGFYETYTFQKSCDTAIIGSSELSNHSQIELKSTLKLTWGWG